MSGSDLSLPHSEVQAQLQQILHSERFRKSARLNALLKYLLDETLAGRAHTLIQYRIATEGLGMKDDFDPDRKSLVRSHAARLRKELTEYYEDSGQNDPIHISMDSPGYGLIFTRKRDAPSQSERAVATAPVLAVAEFRGIGLTPAYRSLPALLSEELIAQSSRAEGLSVIGSFTRRELGGVTCDFSLSGSIEQRDGLFVIRARLLDNRTQLQVWSLRKEYPTQEWNIATFEAVVPQAIAREIGGHFGRIDRHLIRISQVKSHLADSSQNAILKAKAFEYDYSEASYRDGISALHSALANDPENPILHEALGTLLIVAHGEYFRRGAPFPEEAYHHLAVCRRILPDRSMQRHAFAYALILTGQIPLFVKTSGEILSDPDYPPILAGLVIACRIYTKTATAKDRQRLISIISVQSGYPRIVHSGLALEHLADGNLVAAEADMSQFPSSGYWFWHVVQTAIHTAAGRLSEARMERDRLLSLCPDFDQHGENILSRSLHPDYVNLLMTAQKAASV